MTDIRIKLKSVIKDKGYCQAAIASKAGMSPYKLSQVVNLGRKLYANEMFAVCQAIDMTPVELAEYNSESTAGRR